MTDKCQMADVWFAPSYLGIVIFLFGITSTYLAYLVSLFASSQLAAFAFVAGGQAVFLLIYFVLFVSHPPLVSSSADKMTATWYSSLLPTPRVYRRT